LHWLAAIGDFGGTMRKFALLGLFFAFHVGAVAQTGAADPRIGSWTLISAQSTQDPPNKLSITQAHGAVHVIMSGETHIDFTAKPDGHDTAVPRNPAFDQVELHRIEKKQTEVKELKNGAVVGTIRVKPSSDSKEIAITTISPGHPDKITVWERTGGAKAIGDPLAGEWTQDLDKTRLRQAVVLKIDGDGNGGVRFSGEESYTARFDGKPYDVKNSRNDLVTLALVDAHTVDAVYKRDDQVSQRDRWVVSADRSQMTLTSTGSLETGQHFSEKLTFKKQ
jgi:hypothetical protein